MNADTAFPQNMYANDRASQGLGITVEVNGEGCAVATFEVTESMLNGFDLCHGGFLFTLADTAFAFACNTYGVLTVAAGASVEFLHPARAGDRLTATARERSRRGRTGVYDVTICNQEGTEVALFRGRAHATGRPLPGMAESDTKNIEK